HDYTPPNYIITLCGACSSLNIFHDCFLFTSRTHSHSSSLPRQRSTPIFYYNKDLFQKAGLDPNQPPKNWTELVADAQKLTVRDPSGQVTQWGVQIPAVDTSPWIIQGFIIQAGGDLADPDGKWVRLN